MFLPSPLQPLWSIRKNKVKSYFPSAFTECAPYSMGIRASMYLIDSWTCQIDESAFCDLMLQWIIRLYDIKCSDIQGVLDCSIAAAKNEKSPLSLLPLKKIKKQVYLFLPKVLYCVHLLFCITLENRKYWLYLSFKDSHKIPPHSGDRKYWQLMIDCQLIT